MPRGAAVSRRCSTAPAAASATRWSRRSSGARCAATLSTRRRAHAAGTPRDAASACPTSTRSLVDDGGDERALAASLAARRYDACVVTWATARTARIPQLANIPVRVGQARRLYSYPLHQPRRRAQRERRRDVALVATSCSTTRARIGCDTGDPRYRFVPTSEDERADAAPSRWAPRPEELRDPQPVQRDRVAARRLAGRGLDVARRALRDRFSAPVLVSGSPADERVRGRASPRTPATASSRSRARLGIGAFGALARRARAFVGITTGSMHVAAAVGCPTVGIFPFQSDYPERWAPLGTRTAVVRAVVPVSSAATRRSAAPTTPASRNLDVPRVLAAAAMLV